MRKKISITCPHCGKLNQRNADRCSSCGYPLPNSNQPGQQIIQIQSKRVNRYALIVLGIFLAIIVVSFSIKQNQQVLRTSSMTVTPYRVDFFDRHHQRVMSRYLRGGTSTRRNGYARGKMMVTTHLKAKGKWSHYVDSRAKGILIVDSQPRLTFYYDHQRGKFNDYGRCRVAGYHDIKTFRMVKLDSGTN